MVPAETMCSRHLSVEHKDLHNMCSALSDREKTKNLIQENAVEPGSIVERHKEIEKELHARGMKTDVCVEECDITHLSKKDQEFKIDKKEVLKTLTTECRECSALIERTKEKWLSDWLAK